MNIWLTQIISISEVERNKTGKNQMSQLDSLNFSGLTKTSKINQVGHQLFINFGLNWIK